jgi:NAD(P)-dependent dehydrogenase (short-subunit alcohol dehydrogenase family)
MSVLDKFSLRGKVAIVTGGNRGVGKAIARGFAEAGAAVAIIGRDEKKSAETLAELRDLGGNAIAVRANVAERSDLEAMLATVTDELGPVDVLVNNAGIGFTPMRSLWTTRTGAACSTPISTPSGWRARSSAARWWRARQARSSITGRSPD